MNIIKNKLPPTGLTKKDWVAIDVEIFGAEKHKLHRPTTGEFGCVTIATNENDVYFIDDVALVPLALGRVEECIWVMHNMSFDITHNRRWDVIPTRKRMWDTMAIEKILYSGYFDRFGLADCVRRHLDIYIDKKVRKQFEEMDEFTPESIKYSCEDALYTLQVAKAQKKLLKERPEVFKNWKSPELPAQWAFIDKIPFRFDQKRWLEINEGVIEEKEELEKLFDFNPRSPAQVKKAISELGVDVDSTGIVVLQKLSKRKSDTVSTFAKNMMKYRTLAKRASSYGAKFVDKYVEEGEYVRSNIKSIGASTFRTASSNPNEQQIPSRGEGLVYRDCFIARPGRKIIVADWSQQEVGIVAYWSKDQTLIDIINAGGDVYARIASLRFDREIKKEDIERKKIKDIVLGLIYGMSAHGLSVKWECSVEEAQRFIDSFFELFPVLKEYVERTKNRVKEGYVLTLTGKRVHLNPYSGQAKRNALNAPNQGGAADMMKLALGRIHQKWDEYFDFPFALVAQVHDELVFDIPDKDINLAKRIIEREMVNAGNELCPGVVFRVGIDVCEKWSEAK